MHPAASVILFTTLSGAGYGLLFWLGLWLLAGRETLPDLALPALAVGFVLVSVGLLASVAHLGRPLRAWRAFSQWRSSWLSREGMIAVISLAILVALAYALVAGAARGRVDVLALALCVAAALTIYCTARIYSSLRPIPAWHNAWVLPGYAVLAAATGAAWLSLLAALVAQAEALRVVALASLALFVLSVVVKVAYWRHVDRHGAGVDAASALALPAGSRVMPFEAPHTEANFLLKEMGFALARKHGRRLRRIVVMLLCLAPLPILAAAFLQAGGVLAGAIGVLLAMLAVLVERWLFFAQARHVVMTYYDARPS